MHDLIQFQDKRGRTHELVRPAYDSWLAAGSPDLEEGGRYGERQQYLYDGWKAGKPGFNPADNPASKTAELGHVRFIAIDLTHKRDVQRVKNAGWIFPFSWEWWHARLPNPFAYPLIWTPPATGATTTPIRKKSKMKLFRITNDADGNGNPGWWWVRERDGKIFLTFEQTQANLWASTSNDAIPVTRYAALTYIAGLTK